jgi:hypothetical protein
MTSSVPERLTKGLLVPVGPFLVNVRSDLPGVAEHLELLYSDYSINSGEGGHFQLTLTGGAALHRWWRPQVRLVIDGSVPYLPLPLNLAGGVLEWGFNYGIGNFAARFVAVHAAVVERNGRALILSAPSSSGKSTLCAALVLAGWRLFSDEFALIDVVTGEIVPAPRPISLKEAAIDIIRRRGPGAVFSKGGVDVEKQRFVHMRPPADSVHRAAERARPGAIIAPRYTAGAPTTIEPITRARALIGLTGQSFNYTLIGADGYRALARLAGACDAYRLEYSDLDDVLPRLAAMTS